jgi:hypothetical protein
MFRFAQRSNKFESDVRHEQFRMLLLLKDYVCNKKHQFSRKYSRRTLKKKSIFMIHVQFFTLLLIEFWGHVSMWSLSRCCWAERLCVFVLAKLFRGCWILWLASDLRGWYGQGVEYLELVRADFVLFRGGNAVVLIPDSDEKSTQMLNCIPKGSCLLTLQAAQETWRRFQCHQRLGFVWLVRPSGFCGLVSARRRVHTQRVWCVCLLVRSML